MPFDEIEFVGAPRAATVPPAGVRVVSRRAGRPPSITRFIQITIGKSLAARLVMKMDEIRMAVAFGSGADAGKIRLSVDATAGGFTARKNKQGCYALTINAATADGLFSIDFDAFAVEVVDVTEQAHRPPFATFACSEGMLAVED